MVLGNLFCPLSALIFDILDKLQSVPALDDDLQTLLLNASEAREFFELAKDFPALLKMGNGLKLFPVLKYFSVLAIAGFIGSSRMVACAFQ